MNLQECTDYEVMSIKECLDSLEWTYEEKDGRFVNIKCSCGGDLEFLGFVGTEQILCTKCEKHMVDLFSPLPTSNSTCGIIDPRKVEWDGKRHWAAIDGNGGIKHDRTPLIP